MKLYTVLLISLIIFPVCVFSQCDYSYGKWDTTISSMPTTRSCFSAVVYHDSVYILGGYKSLATMECVSPVDVYVPASNTWIAGITEFPFPRACQSACLVGDKIYAMGGAHASGDDLATFDSLHIYDIKSNTWEKGQPLPAELSYFAADTIDGKIYVAGGGGSGYSIYNTLYVYNPEQDEWTEKAPMSISRWGTFARSWNGKLYVFGGYTGSNWAISRSIEVYDPETDEWTGLTSAITPRTSGNMFLHDGQLFVVGGYYNPSSSSYNHTKIISRYDIDSDSWFNFFHEGDNIPDGRRFSGSFVHNGKFYLLGGGGDEEIMDNAWAYSLKSISQHREISDTLFNTESIEINLADYFSSNEGELSYSICPGYNEAMISATIENSLLKIDKIAGASESTELAVNVFNSGDTISSNTFSVDIPLGIHNRYTIPLTVYPNPASAVVDIVYNTASAGRTILEIYNSMGQVMDQFSLDNTEAGPCSFEWNVEYYNNGLYIIVLKTSVSHSVYKLLIQH